MTCKAIVSAVLLLVAAGANAQSSSTASNSTAADAGAMAQTGNITTTFEAAPQRGHTSVSTTPSAYLPPSMFGGATNCGMSDSVVLGVTGASGGFSRSKESDACNAREDTAIAYKLGMQSVALLRFMCFGADENRMAYEAAGNICPQGATAQGLPEQEAAAPVGYQGNDPVVRQRLGMQ